MSKKLQEFLPYLFPLLAVVFVVVMFARWYQSRTAETPTGLLDPQFAVEALPTEVQNNIVRGAAGYESVKLQGEEQAMGEVRYQVEGDKFTFAVSANLPASREEYVVWLTDEDNQARQRVFNLSYSKAGYVGSAVVAADILPVRVVISKASDLLLQDVLLQADIDSLE